MGKRGSRKAFLARRRQQIAERYCEGQTQTEIALALGISQGQVSRTLDRLRENWLERSMELTAQIVADELAKIDHLEREYWQAWQRSKRPKETRQTERQKGTAIDAGNSGHRKRKRTVEQQTGNPAYLAGVERCVNARVALLGLKPREPQAADSAEDKNTLMLEVTAMDATIQPPGVQAETVEQGEKQEPNLLNSAI